MHGDDEVGRAIREFVSAYEDALLVYADLKTRYSRARFDEQTLKQPAPASMRADGLRALESQQRVVSAIKRIFALTMEAGLRSGAISDQDRPRQLTEHEWFVLGMRLGREVSAVIGRGQAVDLRSLQAGKWT